jgi:hypothetical protein
MKSERRCDRQAAIRGHHGVIVDDSLSIAQGHTIPFYLFCASSCIRKVAGGWWLENYLIRLNLLHFLVNNVSNISVKRRDMDDPLAYTIGSKMHVIECSLTGISKITLGTSTSNGKLKDRWVPSEEIVEFFKNVCVGHLSWMHKWPYIGSLRPTSDTDN